MKNKTRLLKIIKSSDANRKYFFKLIIDSRSAQWLAWLEDNGFFADLPEPEKLASGSLHAKKWFPGRYLIRVAKQEPAKVVQIVLQLGVVNNAGIASDLLEIALQLPIQESLEIKEKIFAYLKKGILLHDSLLFNLLARWIKHNCLTEALELLQIITQSIPENYFTSWQCQQLLDDGVLPLIEQKPLPVAEILIAAIASRLSMGTYRYKLFPSEHDDIDFDEMLTTSLTVACESFYEKFPNKIDKLDKELRNQPSDFFKRLRQHLYTKFISTKTKPKIRELIVTSDSYGKHPYSVEFSQLIESSCQYFKESLLSTAEREEIFAKIIAGVVETDTHYSSDDLRRTQLYPFAEVLFGEYKKKFDKLVADYDKNHPDKVIYFYPETLDGSTFNRSAFSPTDLEKLSDTELLTRINTWQDELTFSKDDCIVRITIKGLSSVFQEVFRETIVHEPERLQYWLDNKEKIARPIYVQAILEVARSTITPDNLSEWLSFCKWVLSHPDRGDSSAEDTLRINPDWHGARVAVHNLIATNLMKKNELLIDAIQPQLTEILTSLCTQPHRDLDRKAYEDGHSQFTIGMHFSRGRSLVTLLNLALKKRFYLTVLTKVLDIRFVEQTFTLPEFGVLGYMLPGLERLDKKLVERYREKIFPQANYEKWLAAFEGFIGYHAPSDLTFTIIRNEFDYCLQHLQKFRQEDRYNYSLADKLSDLFFYYYMQGKYPLLSDESLLYRYYQKTAGTRQHWGKLFARVGYSLRRKNINKNQQHKAIAFLKWRVAAKESSELANFVDWLNIGWLDDKLCLDMCGEILQLCKITNVATVELWLEKLCSLCATMPTETVNCLYLLVMKLNKKTICYLRIKYLKPIIDAGEKSLTNQAKVKEIKAHLLREDWLDLDELDDDDYSSA